MDWREPRLDLATQRIRDIPAWWREKRGWGPNPFKSKTSSAESHLLYRTARDLGPGNYADVGVYRGASTVCLASGLYDGGHHGTVYAVDFFAAPELEQDDFCDNEATPALLTQHFAERYPSTIQLKICPGDSSNIGFSLNVPFNFVFIDACHTFEGCMRDYVAWERLIVPGGCLAFHDTNLSGVAGVIRQIDPHWEFVQQIYSTKLFLRK